MNHALLPCYRYCRSELQLVTLFLNRGTLTDFRRSNAITGNRSTSLDFSKSDALKPGSYHLRRATRFAKPEDIEKRNANLTVSIRFDGDIVEFFKARAALPNAAPYQTQINSALRTFMKGRGAVDLDARKLLGNEPFVAALADRVRELL